MEKILCSACLLGMACRFDGASKPHNKVRALTQTHLLIPICPEQLGGLPTPREPSEIQGAQVLTSGGNNVTRNFEKGAEEVVRIAKLFNITKAILKSKSPSCGKGFIYDGTFSKTLILENGITTQKLLENGIEVISEEEL